MCELTEGSRIRDFCAKVDNPSCSLNFWPFRDGSWRYPLVARLRDFCRCIGLNVAEQDAWRHQNRPTWKSLSGRGSVQDPSGELTANPLLVGRGLAAPPPRTPPPLSTIQASDSKTIWTPFLFFYNSHTVQNRPIGLLNRAKMNPFTCNSSPP